MKQVSQLRRKFLFIVLRDIHVERQIASSKRHCYTIISKLNFTARGNVALNSTEVDIDWRYDNMCGSHLQSQSKLYICRYCCTVGNMRTRWTKTISYIQHIKCCFNINWTAQECHANNATTSCKSTWDTVPYFGLNGLSMILCLWRPLHPFSKLLAIQDHAQNLEEQLSMGGGGRSVFYLTDLWLAAIWSKTGCFFVRVSQHFCNWL